MNKLKITNTSDLTYKIKINYNEVQCSELKLDMSADSVPQLELVLPAFNIEIDEVITDVKTLQEISYLNLLIQISKGNFKPGGIIRTRDNIRYMYTQDFQFERINENNELIKTDFSIPHFLDTYDVIPNLNNIIVYIEEWS